MADWTTIADSVLEVDKPARAIDARALRDNPVAIAEGAVDAPRVDPINAMAHQGAVGAVGTYAFLSGGSKSAGQTLAGSSLIYGGAVQGYTDTTSSGAEVTPSGVPSGAWRCMGVAGGTGGPDDSFATLWLRIS